MLLKTYNQQYNTFQLFSLVVFFFSIFMLHSQAQLVMPRYSQHATLTQTIGTATISIDYSRPSVTLNGEDRTGKIWGELIPFEMGQSWTGKPMPWRAGADENTVFHFSHDVKIEGQTLVAGKYGFHIIPHKDGKATLIFSTNTNMWGSYMYDDAEDALRVTTRMEDAPHTELLTIEFTEIQKDRAVCALSWEKKRIPFSIAFDIHPIVLQNIKDQLGQSASFYWQSFDIAANYCLRNKVDLEQGLSWADQGINYYGGNFTLYQTKAKLLEALGKAEEAQEARQLAIAEADIYELHQYASALAKEGKAEEAISAFQRNFEKYQAKGTDIPWENCAVHIGLAKAEELAGQKKKALALAEKALSHASSNSQKKQIETYISKLKS